MKIKTSILKAALLASAMLGFIPNAHSQPAQASQALSPCAAQPTPTPIPPDVAKWRALADSSKPVVEVLEGVEHGDVSVLSGPVVVRGTVKGNIYVLSGDVFVLGTVKGDVSCVSGSVYVLGRVDGAVKIVSGKLFKSGCVGGETNVVTDGLSSGTSTTYSRTWNYSGSPRHFEIGDASMLYFLSLYGMAWRFCFGMLWLAVAILFAALAPNLLEHGQTLVTSDTAKSLAVGFVWKLIFWVLAIIFFLASFLLIGLPLLALLLAAQWALVVVGYSILFLWVGRRVLGRIMPGRTYYYRSIFIGGLLFAVFRLIPVIGTVGWWLTGIFAGGIAVRYLFATRPSAVAYQTAPSIQPQFIQAPGNVNRQPRSDSMNANIQIVAALHIAMGALSLLVAIAVFAALGMLGGIVVSQGEHEAAGIIGIAGVVLVGFLAVLALPGIIGGWALFAGRSWGRPFVMVLGVIQLLNIPFGTVLGIYTLWALLREPTPQAPSASDL